MWSCCATYNEAKEEVVGDPSAADERCEQPRPPTPLSVRVCGAASVNGVEGLRCLCQVPNRPDARVEGAVPQVGQRGEPVLEAKVPGYCVGDSLCFRLLTQGSEKIGEAVLQPSIFQRDGFSGEIALEGSGGKTAAYLLVSITGEDGKIFPPLPAAATGFRAFVECGGSEGDKGLDLDLMDRAYARVNGIQDGPAEAFNQAVEPLYRIRVDDFIYSVNTSRWSRDFGTQFKNKKSLSLVVKRPLKFNLQVEKSSGTLGLDLWYEHESSPALVVTKVNDGPVSQWNIKNSDRRLERFDRIVGVNGKTGNATALLQHIRDSEDQLDLVTVRPTPAGPSAGPIDVSGLTRMAANDQGLLPQPEHPKARLALVQIYVRGQAFGGSDKSANGHRYDSIPIANGMIANGMSCQLIHYVHQEHDIFFEVCSRFDAIVLRCNPGQIRADGGDECRFDEGMRSLRKRGLQVWPSPDVSEALCKDALCKVASMHIGLEDTLAYCTEEEFEEGFKKTMAFQPRVIKQNRGSSGEGIWIVKLKSGEYCQTYGERSCFDDDMLLLMEANDNHKEEHTVAEFIEFCSNGRTEKSGDWTTLSEGKYLAGGRAAGSQIVDQRFCPRIVEGELRYNMIGETCVGIVHKKPKEGGISAVAGTGSVYTFYGPDEPKFAQLTSNFLQRDLPKIMPALGLPDEPIPLWWTADFILASPVGTPVSEEKWIVGEFNCSCVGISKCLAAYCHPECPRACYADITPEDRMEARRLGNLMGEKALAILKRV